MGLGGVGDVDDGGDVLVRVGDPGGSLWMPAPSARTIAAARRRIVRVDGGVDGVASLGGGSSHRT